MKKNNDIELEDLFKNQVSKEEVDFVSKATESHIGFVMTGDFSYISDFVLRLIKDQQSINAFKTLMLLNDEENPVKKLIMKKKEYMESFNGLLGLVLENVQEELKFKY